MYIRSKLSYRKETARRAMLINLCYDSLGTRLRKVSNSKSDLRRHSWALTMVPLDRPYMPTISCWCSIAIMSLSCIVNEILSLIFQNLKKSRDSEHIAFGGNVSYMHSYSCVLISTRNSKCLALPMSNA